MVAVGLAIGLASCGFGGGEPGGLLGPTSSVQSGESVWRRVELSFDPPIGIDEHSGEVRVAGLRNVVAHDGQWRAVLSSEVGDVEVESTDLGHWTRSAAEVAPGASVGAPQPLSDGFVRVGRIGDDERAEAYVERSDDGETWTRWELGGARPPKSIQRIETLGDLTVVFGAVAAGEYASVPGVWVARSDGPLVAVDELPWKGEEIDVTGPGRVGDELVALSEEWIQEGEQVATVWRSRDGVTWVADLAVVRAIGARGLVTLDDRVVFGGWYGAAITIDAGGVRRSGPGRARVLPWEIAHQDEFDRPVAWDDDAVLPGTIVARADADFCYDDLASCRQPRPQLLLVDGGDLDREIDLPTIDGWSVWIASVVVTDERVVLGGSVFREVWREVGNDGPEQYSEHRPALWVFDRVDGSLPPAVPIVHEEPNPPRHPTLDDDAEPEVGTTYRATVPIGGGCGAGRLSFGDRYWQATEDWGEWPYPDDWPVRHLGGVSDAPTDYLYGTLTLNADDTISVGIERGDDVEILRTYERATPPEFGCG